VKDVIGCGGRREQMKKAEVYIVRCWRLLLPALSSKSFCGHAKVLGRPKQLRQRVGFSRRLLKQECGVAASDAIS